MGLAAKYDKQEDIYPGLLATLKEAADGFADGGSDDLGEGDLLFGGDIEKWQRYCNSMRLRLAMRISEVSPALAKETVEEVWVISLSIRSWKATMIMLSSGGSEQTPTITNRWQTVIVHVRRSIVPQT